MPATTSSRLASFSTITGALPPNSMWVRFMVWEAISTSFLPVAMEPVSDTMRTRGWLTSGMPTSPPRPWMMLTTPGGSSSASNSPSARVESGVTSEGLSTTVLPAASAGPSFQAAIISG